LQLSTFATLSGVMQKSLFWGVRTVFDPFETWATKDFRSAKACSSRFAKRDIVLSICWV
jgi:hypothetical protein